MRAKSGRTGSVFTTASPGQAGSALPALPPIRRFHDPQPLAELGLPLHEILGDFLQIIVEPRSQFVADHADFIHDGIFERQCLRAHPECRLVGIHDLGFH